MDKSSYATTPCETQEATSLGQNIRLNLTACYTYACIFKYMIGNIHQNQRQEWDAESSQFYDVLY